MRCKVKSAVFSVLTGAVLWQQSVAAEPDPALGKALASYKQQNYSQAYKLFADSAGRSPGDGTAWLYAANCLYHMGNTSSALRLYSYVQINFAKTPNGPLAAEMLKRLGGSASASSGNASAEATSGEGPVKRALEDPVKRAVEAGPADCRDLVEIVSPLYGHPPVAENTVRAVLRAVRTMPANVTGVLRRNGAKVFLMPTLIDKEPSLKNREGRGYDGYTYKSCPGMFWNNKVYLCERTLDEGDDSIKEPMLLSSIIGTLYHECGHALDEYFGNISGTEEFKHAYLLDCGKIDAETKAELSYFLQKSDAGQQECCGELIGIMLGKSDKKADKMREVFPLTLRLLRSKINPENAKSQ